MPLNNFGRVGPGVFRSEQPDAYAMSSLYELGITVVLKLNDATEGVDEPVGELVVWSVPLELTPPSDAQVRELCAGIRAHVAAGERVLIHCTHGRDRTGFVAAAYQLLELKRPLDEVLDTRARYGVNTAVVKLFNEAFTKALRRLAQQQERDGGTDK